MKCEIKYKGKDYSFEEYIELLNSGEIDALIRDGVLDRNELKGEIEAAQEPRSQTEPVQETGTEVKGEQAGSVVGEGVKVKAKTERKREDFPDSQANTRTPITQKLLDYFAETLGIPKFNENLSKGTYVSWLQNANPIGYAVAEKLNAPKQAFDVIAKYDAELKAVDELLGSQTEPVQETGTEVKGEQVERTNRLIALKNRYNNLSKKDKKTIGLNLKDQIEKEAKNLGYQVFSAKAGNIKITQGGKRVSKKGVTRTVNQDTQTRKKALSWASSGSGGLRAAIIAYFVEGGTVLASQSEMGEGTAEMASAKRRGVISDKGTSIDSLVNEILPEMGVYVTDEQDAINEVQDVLWSYETKAQMMDDIVLEYEKMNRGESMNDYEQWLIDNIDPNTIAFVESLTEKEVNELAKDFDEYWDSLTDDEKKQITDEYNEYKETGVFKEVESRENDSDIRSKAESEYAAKEKELKDKVSDLEKKRRNKIGEINNAVSMFGEEQRLGEMFEVENANTEEALRKQLAPIENDLAQAKRNFDDFVSRKSKFIADVISREQGQLKINDKSKSKARQKAEELRKKAQELRDATRGTAMVAPKLVAAAYDAYATLLEKYDDAVKAFSEFKKTKEYKALGDEDRAMIDAELSEDTGQEPPKTEAEPKQEAPKGKSKRTLFTRAYEGVERESSKKKLSKYGLDRDVENRLDAAEAAKSYVQEVGIDTALNALRVGDVSDAAAAFVYAELIDSIEEKMLSEKDPDAFSELEDFQTELINEFDRKTASSARFLGALQDVYRTAKFNYKASRKIEEYKQKNNGEIPAEIEQKFKDLEAKLKDVEKRLEQAEENARKEREKQLITTIREVGKKTETFAVKAKRAADNFRTRYKKDSFTLKDADGNPIKIQGLTWNDIVEVGAKAIEASGKIADGVAAMIEKLKEQQWYIDLSDADKKAVNDQVEKTFSGVYVPPSMLREIVESGVDTIDGLVKAVMKELSGQFPNATERDFRDAITGYGKEAAKTKDDIQNEINRLKRVGVLLSKIEDAKNGAIKAKKPNEKKKLQDEEKRLKKELDNILEMSGIKDMERTERAKENAKNKIEDLKRRLREGDFSKAKKTITKSDAELDALRTEKQKYQEEFDTEMHKLELKNRSRREKIIDGLIEAFGLTRALMATAEISFILIQGGIQTIAHPINAARAFKKAMEHFASEKKSKEWGEFVKSTPWYQKARKSKLALSEYDAKLTAREEQYLGGWVNNIWDIVGYAFTRPFSKKAYEWWKRKNLFKALERASVGYLNTLRALRFQDAVNMLEAQGKTFENNTQEYKDAADVINTMTGRASLGAFEGIAKPLSVIFFSPRNWASILKTSTPMALYHFGKMGQKGSYKPSVAQKMALGDYMKFVGATTSLVAMAAAYLNHDDDEETAVVLDPLSSDFGKIKIGNTRIDPWGGRIQMITYQARMIAGAMIYGGQRQELGVGGAPTRGELALKLAQNKLSPSAGLLVKFLFAEKDKDGNMKSFGKDLVFSEELAGSLYPMYIGTINELYKEQPETVASFLTFYAFLGGGVSTYETNKASIKFKDDKTRGVIQKYRPEMRGLDENSVELEKLTQDEFDEVQNAYKDASERILTAYANSGKVEEAERLADEALKSGAIMKLTDKQYEEYVAQAEKEGTPADQMAKRVNEIAIMNKSFSYVGDKISDLNSTAKKAVIEQYYLSRNKRVPKTVEGYKDFYEKTLNEMLQKTNE